MTPTQVLERLAHDKPLFHYADQDVIRRAAMAGYHFQEGDLSLAVNPGVLKWIAGHVTDSMTTIETGAGYTTVLLGALAKQHYCCTFEAREIEKISKYVAQLGLPLEKISFLLGSTDETLPKIELKRLFDFAYIDGCHGYPFPALDWHYIDLRLKVGGIVGMDNVELRPVREHCDFLEENVTYELIGTVSEGYLVRFYRKLADEPREWVDQAYGRAKKDPCDRKLSTRVRRKLTAAALIPTLIFCNLDYGWHPGSDVCWDITRGLPFPDHYVRGVFTEHCLEHFSLNTGLAILGEIHRIMRPRAVLRIVVPDGELYLRSYASRIALPYAQEDAADFPIATPMVSVNRIFRRHGHLFIWDFETLAAALLKSGFHDVTKAAFGEGCDDKLLIDTPVRKIESLYVEAIA